MDKEASSSTSRCSDGIRADWGLQVNGDGSTGQVRRAEEGGSSAAASTSEYADARAGDLRTGDDDEGAQTARSIRVVKARWAMEEGPLLRGSTIAYRHDCGAAWFGIDGRMFVGWPHIRILQRTGRQLSEAFGMVRFWRQTWWTGVPESKTAGGGPTKPLPDRDVREGGRGQVDPTPKMTGLHARNVESEQGEPTNVKAGSMRGKRPKKKRICEGQSRRGGWEEEYKVSQLRHCGWEYKPRR